MLAYLDALVAALVTRDAMEIDRLVTHPLARILPPDVREEAGVFLAGHADPLAAPLRTMRLRHQTAELLRELPEVADRPAVVATTERQPSRQPAVAARAAQSARLAQMELSLSA
ncbi:MAG: hypothetical protein ACKVS7_14890 [Gemmatimonadaceae bacterium]